MERLTIIITQEVANTDVARQIVHLVKDRLKLDPDLKIVSQVTTRLDDPPEP